MITQRKQRDIGAYHIPRVFVFARKSFFLGKFINKNETNLFQHEQLSELQRKQYLKLKKITAFLVMERLTTC